MSNSHRSFASRRALVLGAAAIVASLGLSGPARAQATDRVEGEVRRVNLAEGKVTLRHGPLEKLDMPGMTMVFTARDPSLLRDLSVGEKVMFTAEHTGGVFYVVEIVRAR